MKLVLASSNHGKLEELRGLLSGTGIELIAQSGLGVEDADETGATFVENALLKARKIYDFITTQAVYRFMPPYLTVTNIPEYFLSGLRGDCGVQAITFVTLCRLCGVPAQWQSGL